MDKEQEKEPQSCKQERCAGENEQTKQQEAQNKFINLMNRVSRLRLLQAKKRTLNTMAKTEFTRKQ